MGVGVLMLHRTRHTAVFPQELDAQVFGGLGISRGAESRGCLFIRWSMSHTPRVLAPQPSITVIVPRTSSC